MPQRKRFLRGAAVAAAAVLALPAGPASGTSDYTVTSGGSTTAVAATNVGYLHFGTPTSGPVGIRATHASPAPRSIHPGR
jgi:hypothetical protein